MDQNLDIHSSSLLEEGFKTLWKFIQLGNNLQIKKTCEENPTLINHRNQKGKTILIKIIENSRNISKNISTDKYEFIIKTLLNFGFDSNIPDNKDLDVRNLCIKILGIKIFGVEILTEDISGILEHIVKILSEIISVLSN